MEIKDILVSGNLHIYDVPLTAFKPKGIVIHVEGDIFVHKKEDDFIYPATDKFIENLFEDNDIKDIILYSPKFKKNQS